MGRLWQGSAGAEGPRFSKRGYTTERGGAESGSGNAGWGHPAYTKETGKVLGADRFGDLGGLFGGEEFFDQGEAEIQGGAGAAGGDQAAVDDDAFVGEDRGEFVGDGEVRGITFACEESGVVKGGGRGADGGEPAAGRGVLFRERRDAGIGAEVFHAGAAGEKEQVEGAIRRHGGERGIGVHREAAASGDVDAVAERGDDDVGSSATEDIDGRDGFDLFKTLWQNDEDRGHVFRVNTMSTDAPGFLRGKRLVVFGAGYVGGALGRQALAAGARVTALTRNAEKAREFLAEGMEVILGDLATQDWHDQIAGGADFVVNCVSGGGKGVEGYRRSYLDGMRSITAWLTSHGGAGATVYTSSTSVYPQDGGARIDETAPVDRTQERPRVLVEAEELLMDLPAFAGRRTVLRLAGIYGPQRHHLLEQVRSGEVAGLGEHHLNLIHRDDICAAVWGALNPEKAGVTDRQVFNVADDGAAPKKAIVRWLAARLGVAEPVFSGAPAEGRRAITPDRIIANDKIAQVLGWRPRYPSFREGYAAILGA